MQATSLAAPHSPMVAGVRASHGKFHDLSMDDASSGMGPFLAGGELARSIPFCGVGPREVEPDRGKATFPSWHAFQNSRRAVVCACAMLLCGCVSGDGRVHR